MISLPEYQQVDSVIRGGLVWTVCRASRNDGLLQVLENPDAYFEDVGKLPRNERPSTSVARHLKLFLKRYNRTSPSKLVKSVFRRAPAEHAFRLADQLAHAGILTPRTLAVAHKRVFRVLLRSYLVTEAIPNARTIDQWNGQTKDAAQNVAAMISNLHENGFVHRDLNPSNLLFDSENQLFLVDLDTMRFVKRVSERRALDDLARFSRKAMLCSRISRTHRLRFLQHYCELRQLPEWQRWWDQIEILNRQEFERLARKKRITRPEN